MKRLLVLILSIVSPLAPSVVGAGTDNQYVRAYALIQEADQFARLGQKESARAKYSEAQLELKRIQTGFPDWNPGVIKFRLDYVSGRIEELGSAPSAAASKAEVDQTVEPSADPEIIEIRRLQSANAVLQSKLKEALAARPAALDPLELERAEERIRLLEKEKELLRLALESEKSKHTAEGESEEIRRLNSALVQANARLSDQAEVIVALRREKEILETRLHSALQNTNAAQEIRVESQEAKDQRVPGEPGPGQIARVPVESINRTVPDAPRSMKSESGGVEALQMALAKLQAEKVELERVKTDLEAKLEIATSDPASQANRVRQVENERDELLKKLNETTRRLYDNKARTDIIQREQYESQLEILRARLEVFEAREVPFTEEEKALFNKSGLSLTEPDQGGGKDLPPRGAEQLAMEAERAFAARRFDEAGERFREILRLDPQSAYALANLATIDLQQNRLTEAEANLSRALGLSPGDTHSMTLMGVLRFTQERFDEALDLLSRAAQSNPNDPQTQNYLGITLSHKGQRGPAETALRRAVQLAPDYGGAHQNLAIIYATQEPPFKELARWHYQKSLATGHPANTEIEKLIEGDPNAVRAE